jgi:hypothetical protein
MKSLPVHFPHRIHGKLDRERLTREVTFDVDQPIESVEGLESLGTIPHHRENPSKKASRCKAVGNRARGDGCLGLVYEGLTTELCYLDCSCSSSLA